MRGKCFLRLQKETGTRIFPDDWQIWLWEKNMNKKNVKQRHSTLNFRFYICVLTFRKNRCCPATWVRAKLQYSFIDCAFSKVCSFCSNSGVILRNELCTAFKRSYVISTSFSFKRSPLEGQIFVQAPGPACAGVSRPWSWTWVILWRLWQLNIISSITRNKRPATKRFLLRNTVAIKVF